MKKNKLFLALIPLFLIMTVPAHAQDYLEYLQYFTEDVSTFNAHLSSSMAQRFPVMANTGVIDASTNLSGHLFTAGISLGSAFTPDFYTSLTEDASYHLLDVSDHLGIEEDLDYLPLPSFNLYGKVNIFSNWALGARINFITSFERENFKFNNFTLNVFAQRSLFKSGDESGVSLAPFFTYTRGEASYSTDPYVIPFSFNNLDFALEGVLNFKLDYSLYSLGVEAKASQKLLFFHPFVGALLYTNFGTTTTGTLPTIELKLLNPPQLLLKTNLALIEEEGTPEAFQTHLFGGLEFSAFIVKFGIRLDYEVVTSSFGAHIGLRILI